jgi:hypothetical protein
MIFYRVALQMSDSSAWKWRSAILTSLEALFRLLRMYGGLPKDRIRVFFASSRQGLDEMLTRENRGAASNSMTVDQLAAQRWWISPSEVRRVEAELCPQENKGSGSHTVVTEQPVSEKLMNVPEMTQVKVDQRTGADHDIPYIFTLPSFLPEALSWARLLAKVHAGKLVSGELVSEEEPFPLSDVFGT